MVAATGPHLLLQQRLFAERLVDVFVELGGQIVFAVDHQR
jgi:hypothetical protein